MPLILHSNPSAPAALYINFDGLPAINWEGTEVPATPAYAGDDVARTTIVGIVDAAFAPFDIDVTTEAPADISAHKVSEIVVGGNDSAWTGQQLTGYSYIGSFSNPFASPIAWVFAREEGDNLTGIARVIEHEAGHTFGLQHQSTWIAGVKIAEYGQGNPDIGPIMGDPDGSALATWWVGTNSNDLPQDDAAVLTSVLGPSTPEPAAGLLVAAVLLRRKRRISK